VPDDWSVDDFHAVKRANPTAEITPADLKRQRGALPHTAFAQFHACRWGVGEGSWLPPGAWHACVGIPQLKAGEDIWIGVDVGGERSATAVVWVTKTLHVGCSIYHGDPGVLDAVERVRELARAYNVRELVYDPWRFGQAAQELEREGMLCVAFPQHDARVIPASARLHSTIVERRITLPDHDELARHASNAIARQTRRGWRIDKPNPRTNIDAMIALAMAVERAEFEPEPVQLLAWL
jgi:phage terminase large subunit-like protein